MFSLHLILDVVEGCCALLCLRLILLSIFTSLSLGCEQDRLFFSLPQNEYQTMKVQNNSVIIICDSLYLIYLKGSFFQEVGISLHFRKGADSVRIPTMDRGQRVDYAMVASLRYKDIVYLNVKASNTSCEDLQINGGELILIQLNPVRYCAPYGSTPNMVPL